MNLPYEYTARPGAHGETEDAAGAAFIAECADGAWFHCRPIEPHVALPDLARRYIQPGTGNTEAPCLTCGSGEVVVYHPVLARPLESPAEHQHMGALFPPPTKPATRRLQTVTVEITMEVKGDLRRFIDSALASIPTRGGRKEWVYLDA